MDRRCLTLLAMGVTALVGCSPDSALAPPRSELRQPGGIQRTHLDGTVWTTRTPMPTGRGGLGVGVVNGILYAAGGGTNVLEAYNPSTDSWATKAPMAVSRYGLGVGVLNGILYAVGGSSGLGCGGTLYASLEAYDPATNTWTTKAPMPVGKCELGSVIGVNGRLYVIGGLTFAGRTGTVDAYDPVTNSWASRAPMPTGRGWAGIGLLNGLIYAVGGLNNSSSLVSTVEAYDPVTNSWVSKAALPTLRYAPAVATVGGKLFAIGSLTEPSRATIDSYDAVSNSWSSEPSMPTPRGALAADAVNGIVYAVGGYTNAFSGLRTVEALVPPPPPLPLPVPSNPMPQVSAGFYHNCAVKAEGTVICWGDNSLYGQTTVPAGLAPVAQVSAGFFHNCALKAEGRVICWGDNYYGQSTVPAGLASVARVSAGGGHACVLQTDGKVVCWGYNAQGQATVPGELASVAQVSAGVYHSCALKVDGAVVCWGSNFYAQATVPAGLASVSQVSAGGHHTCALTTDGLVVCWGYNHWGQATVPGGLASVAQVSTGLNHSCAVKTDRTVVCWGYDGYGQAKVPGGLASVAQVSAGYAHTCALKADGTIVCWGLNDYGQASVPAGLNLTGSPNKPPLANAGADRLVAATSTAGASVTLDGSASSDSDGDVLTFNWTGPFGAISGVTPTVILPIGTHIVTLTVSDGETTATSTVQITVRDTTAPVITPAVTGSMLVGINDWYWTDVAVSWSVVDNESAITSNTGCGSSTVTTNVAGLTLTCTAVSAGGTATRSVTINRDATVPTVTATVSGTQGTDGWYTSDVQVAWTTTSAGPSGVSPPCAPETQTTDTRGRSFTCDARTGAGIPGRGTVFVKRDGTAPVSTINSAVDGDGSAVASGGSTLSNSATFMFGGTDAYGIALFECSLDAATFTACLSPRTYSGQGIGVHTFRVRAADLAGNSSSPATFTWAVITAAQAVQNLTTTITSIGLSAGVANSLSAPLKNLNTSNLSASCGQLDAFVSQVNAKVKNGQLTVAASSQLLEAANAIKKSLGCG